MTAVTHTFSGSVMLPKALVVTPDCLGQTIRGKTDDELFTLTFPRLAGDDGKLRPPEFHEPQWLDDENFNPRDWGSIPGTADLALVAGFAIWVDTTAVPDGADLARRDTYAQEEFPLVFARWIGRVSTLLELWAGQGVQRFHPSKSEGPVVQLFDHQSDTGFTAEAVEITSVANAGSAFRLLSFADWQSAAHFVSHGDPLDVAWQMFNRAQKLAQTEPRFAVIEACTAVEVAVGRRVAESLFGHPKEAQDQILTDAAGLVGLVRLHDKLFPRDRDRKRPDFSNTLARLRNEVAHMGKLPSDIEVVTALNTARRMLDEVCPLPSPDP